MEIRKSELAEYGDRAKRGELLIHGMAVTPNGYRLSLSLTPRMVDALAHPPLSPVQQPKTLPEPSKAQETAFGEAAARSKLAIQASPSKSVCKTDANESANAGLKSLPSPPIPSPEPPTSPSATVGMATVEAVAAPVMEPLFCPFCTNELDPDGTCGICLRMSKIAGAAAERRRAWHNFKKGIGPRPL